MARFSKDRQQQVFDTTLCLLSEKGYQKLTMLDIAQACQMSKETLYRWFGSKAGLFNKMITQDVDVFKANLNRLFNQPNIPPYEVIRIFALQYYDINTGDNCICVNAAAISEAKTNPELAQILLDCGRNIAFPLLVAYIENQQKNNIFNNQRSAENLGETLLGLGGKDIQIRLLLEDNKLDLSKIDKEQVAKEAADDFMKLFATI
ncbi:MAG: TetR/AcrR family transcriptional regulator [Alphaproteobacteria bacterium]